MGIYVLDLWLPMVRTQVLECVKSHPATVLSLDFSEDGNKIVSADTQGNLCELFCDILSFACMSKRFMRACGQWRKRNKTHLVKIMYVNIHFDACAHAYIPAKHIHSLIIYRTSSYKQVPSSYESFPYHQPQVVTTHVRQYTGASARRGGN
jgi:hypothetical protein